MAITDGLSMLSINCIRCAFGPGSIASRGFLFGVETVFRNWRSERDALSGWSFKRKVHPGIRAWNGTQFPDRPSTGNCDPEFDARTGYAFRIASRRKLHPILSLHSGTRFPQGASSGKRIPFRAPIPGRSFRWPAVWKVHPSLSVHSGMRFPLKDSTGKHIPF